MVVVDNLVNVQRDFLWAREEGRRKIAWVSWKKICCPRSHGGLRIKDINLFNNALLGKWR